MDDFALRSRNFTIIMKVIPMEPHCSSTWSRGRMRGGIVANLVALVAIAAIAVAPACTEGGDAEGEMPSASTSGSSGVLTSGSSQDPPPDGSSTGQTTGADDPGPADSTTGGPPPVGLPNIVFIIADDYGVGASSCYGVGSDFAPTPNIQELCDRGVVFTNAWSGPTCTPTRASTLTGRYSYRTGLGNAIGPMSPVGLSQQELTIPEALSLDASLGYAHACIGKWHVGEMANPDHPNLSGFDHYSGLITGTVQDYFEWDKTVDGETSTIDRYATTEHIDDAIAWLDGRRDPWFLWVGLIAPHSPFHRPPDDLHSFDGLSGTPMDIEANPGEYYRAMIEAMDTEIGRLLASIPAETLANTYVVFMGDNGPENAVAEAPYEPMRSKGTLYQGGVNVPLIIAGPGVVGEGRSSDQLVHVVDLFPTVIEWAGVDAELLPDDLVIDGVSLVSPLADPDASPVHEWIITELFGGMAPLSRQGRSIRDDRYKLIRFANGTDEFYDLVDDPYESTNLLDMPLVDEAAARLDALTLILEQNGGE